MPRRLLTLTMGLAAAASLALGVPAAQAVVVDMSATGQTTVPYNASDQSGYFGVALVPGTRASLKAAQIPTVTSSGPCSDPKLPSDMTLASTGLCSHGGTVLHTNQTFALVWDSAANLDYAASYVEQYLKDVASASNTLASPYAVTTQYTDATGRAGNSSVFGGGYEDASTPLPAPGGCVPSGSSHEASSAGGFADQTNTVCLTDAQIRTELGTMVTQKGLASRIQPGDSPVLVLLTPPGVETCLDAGGKLCSANSDGAQTPAQFCSYHSQVNLGGTVYEYVVQPWTVNTGCDEPDAPSLPSGNPGVQTMATDVGARLVSPLSQSHIAAIVNPGLNAWFGLDGSEINDNTCVPQGQGKDSVSLAQGGQNPYFLQGEFNNGGAIAPGGSTPTCATSVVLKPAFTVPSSVNQGDVVQFDGSQSTSTLLVPKAGYVWDFGDGTSATGPTATHSYKSGGNYTVKLTVTDRGGNSQSTTQTIQVAAGSSAPTNLVVTKPGFAAQIQLLPESLRAMLHGGITLRLTSNQAADALATVAIPGASARRAHVTRSRAATHVVGRGTISGLKAGITTLHLRLPHKLTRKLRRLHHVTITVRISLFAAGGAHVAVDAAGRY